MNAEEQKVAKAAAWLEFTEAKERRALLENEAEKLAKHFDALAELIRKRPETITFEGDAEAFRDYKRLSALVEDLKTTRTELQRLHGVVRDTGGGHLLNTKN